MKKLTLALAAGVMMLGLAGCNHNVDSVQKKLANEGYTVTVKETNALSFLFVKIEIEGLKNTLTATKDSELLHAWFFDTKENADKCWNTYAADFASADSGKEDSGAGVSNNVIYVGTANAVKLAGFTL